MKKSFTRKEAVARAAQIKQVAKATSVKSLCMIAPVITLAALLDAPRAEIARDILDHRKSLPYLKSERGQDATMRFLKRFGDGDDPPTLKVIAQALAMRGGAPAAFVVVEKLRADGRLARRKKRAPAMLCGGTPEPVS